VRSELVILLRPIVVGSDEQWQSLSEEALQRAAALDPKSTAAVR
jgi:hypothetical protein